VQSLAGGVFAAILLAFWFVFFLGLDIVCRRNSAG